MVSKSRQAEQKRDKDTTDLKWVIGIFGTLFSILLTLNLSIGWEIYTQARDNNKVLIQKNEENARHTNKMLNIHSTAIQKLKETVARHFPEEKDNLFREENESSTRGGKGGSYIKHPDREELIFIQPRNSIADLW
jgi:hypothetical protein